MNNESAKIQSFKDLNSWEEGHKLVLVVYKITEVFPKSEIFGLVSQLRRASVSLTSNIVEGFSRNTYKDKLQFYTISLGSLTEIENQLLIARDLGFVTIDVFAACDKQILIIYKLLLGLIKKTKKFIKNS